MDTSISYITKHFPFSFLMKHEIFYDVEAPGLVTYMFATDGAYSGASCVSYSNTTSPSTREFSGFVSFPLLKNSLPLLSF